MVVQAAAGVTRGPSRVHAPDGVEAAVILSRLGRNNPDGDSLPINRGFESGERRQLADPPCHPTIAAFRDQLVPAGETWLLTCSLAVIWMAGLGGLSLCLRARLRGGLRKSRAGARALMPR